MPNHPTGTVTFLFTDIEGSTRLLQSSMNGEPCEFPSSCGPRAARTRSGPSCLKKSARVIKKSLDKFPQGILESARSGS